MPPSSLYLLLQYQPYFILVSPDPRVFNTLHRRTQNIKERVYWKERAANYMFLINSIGRLFNMLAILARDVHSERCQAEKFLRERTPGAFDNLSATLALLS